MASPRRESNPKTCIAPLQEQGRTDRIRPAPLLDVYSAPRKEFAITMAGMISLPSISRLALAAALLVPTIAHASELTPEQMAWYRAQMGLASVSGPPPSPNSVGDAVMEWRRLTANTGASFDQLSRFLLANRDRPEDSKSAGAGQSVSVSVAIG